MNNFLNFYYEYGLSGSSGCQNPAYLSTYVVPVGDKTPKAHPADVAAAAKPRVARPTSAVQSPRKFLSPNKPTDVVRQGSKVADLSRQFSQANLTRQGSAGSDVALPGSKVSNLSRQGSVFSPQKQALSSPGSDSLPQKEALSRQGSVLSPEQEGPGIRQASLSVSLADPPAPATSAAFARAAQLAKLPASSGLAQQTSPQAVSYQAVALHNAAAAAVTTADEPDTSTQPLGSLPGAISPRILAADKSGLPSARPASTAESIAPPAALANFPKTPLSLATEPAGADTISFEFQPQEQPRQQLIMPLPQAEEHAHGEVRPVSEAGTAPRTSGDVRAGLPSQTSASNENIRSTLTAVQKDYVQMIGEQEEDRQAQAAALAEVGDQADVMAADDLQLLRGPLATESAKPAFIPAVSPVPRATARKGNNALFQMLAAGQTGNNVNTLLSVPLQEKLFSLMSAQHAQRSTGDASHRLCEGNLSFLNHSIKLQALSKVTFANLS